MLFWNLQFLPTYAKWRRELQQLSEYFQILKIIFSCNYLDISDKFGLNFGPNNLYNCPNSLVHVLLSSVQLLSHVWLFETPWITARQASLSITISQSSLKFTSIESVMPSSHLILCRPLLLLPLIPPSIRFFSNESTLRMRGPKDWSFSFSIIPSKEHPGLISFRIAWWDF